MNALAHVLAQAARLFFPVEPGFAEPPHSEPTPTFLREATPVAWFVCHCHIDAES
jgi:hypothetical protein